MSQNFSGQTHFEMLAFDSTDDPDFLRLADYYIANSGHNLDEELRRADELLAPFVGAVVLANNDYSNPPLDHMPIGYGWGGTVKRSASDTLARRARGQSRQTVIGRLYAAEGWQEGGVEALLARCILQTQPMHTDQVVYHIPEGDRYSGTIVAQQQLGLRRFSSPRSIRDLHLLGEEPTELYVGSSIGDVISHINGLPNLPTV